MRVTPFRISVEDSALADLHDRLRATRWADDFANDDWRLGVERDWLVEFTRYWAADFDWRAAEATMNSFDHHRVTLDGIPIHFMHVRSPQRGAIPIILTHGWPWTFWDMHAVVGPLSDPIAYGGAGGDAFEVIVPSLPGYGFSSPLRVDGVDGYITADLWHRLATEVLGHERYAVGGGDWGAAVSALVAHRHHESVIGCHLTLPAFPNATSAAPSEDEYGPDEQEFAARTAQRMRTTRSHLAVHTADPQTLAYALEDSPVGLAAWILERRREWSDCAAPDGTRDIDRAFDRDFLATTISIYWFTRTFGTSARFYYHHFRRAFEPSHDIEPVVPVPTGLAVFPEDLFFVPQRTAQRVCDLRQYTLMPRGGHFAHSEQPNLVVEDVRSLFRPLRGAATR